MRINLFFLCQDPVKPSRIIGKIPWKKSIIVELDQPRFVKMLTPQVQMESVLWSKKKTCKSLTYNHKINKKFNKKELKNTCPMIGLLHPAHVPLVTVATPCFDM